MAAAPCLDIQIGSCAGLKERFGGERSMALFPAAGWKFLLAWSVVKLPPNEARIMYKHLFWTLGVLALVSASRGQTTRPLPQPNTIAAGGNSAGYDMAPETNLKVVQAAVAQIPDKIPAGPYSPDWDSIKASYKVPSWFIQAKFGLFMHWGLYAVPAHHSEWYEKHMYAADADWHREHFGPQDKFGYKDFIPL